MGELARRMERADPGTLAAREVAAKAGELRLGERLQAVEDALRARFAGHAPFAGRDEVTAMIIQARADAIATDGLGPCQCEQCELYARLQDDPLLRQRNREQPVLLWQQEYVCWRCGDRIECPLDDAQIWTWPHSQEVRAFEAKHAKCDDGSSLGMELTFTQAWQTTALTAIVAEFERAGPDQLRQFVEDAVVWQPRR